MKRIIIGLVTILILVSYQNCGEYKTTLDSLEGLGPVPPIDPVIPEVKKSQSWKNFYGISWRDNPANSLKYAKQMGYDHIAVNYYLAGQYKNNPDSKGMKYYLINPYYTAIGSASGWETIDSYWRDVTISQTGTRVTVNFGSLWGVQSYTPISEIEISGSPEGGYDGVHEVTQSNMGRTFSYTVSTSANVSLLAAKGRPHWSNETIDFYNKMMVWKSATANFPYHLAASYYSGRTLVKERFRPQWDLQQQAVIDFLVDEMISLFPVAENIVRDENGKINEAESFQFAGYMFDEGTLGGEFQDLTDNGEANMANLHQLTGGGQGESGFVAPGRQHDYSTYSDGSAAFFKKLKQKTLEKFPQSRWALEPYHIYQRNGRDATRYRGEWLDRVSQRSDGLELVPDLLMQEGSSTGFVDQFNSTEATIDGKTVKSLYESLKLNHDQMGTTQPNDVSEAQNRLYAAKAAIVGSWYNWFGRFGGTGNMPEFSSITEVYPRLKLIRCVPNWDNINEVALDKRSWDGTVYKSPLSFISSDLIYSRHPKTKRLFAVFLNANGKITLDQNRSIQSIERADEFFIEAGDAMADFIIEGNTVSIKSSVSFDKDASNDQVKGQAYIISLK